MHITFLTLFPPLIDQYFTHSIMRRARESSKITIDIVNIRDFTLDAHKTVDNPPYGGGPGMVLMIEPIDKALQDIYARSRNKPHVILLSAKGPLYTQQHAAELSKKEHIVLICGHYEGVDERVREHLVDEELSIGQFVVTGGELPALLVADSIVRLIPGVLGTDESSHDESHVVPGELEYPHYTRPQEYKGWKVPEILLSGNHKEIDAWRQSQKRGL